MFDIWSVKRVPETVPKYYHFSFAIAPESGIEPYFMYCSCLIHGQSNECLKQSLNIFLHLSFIMAPESGIEPYFMYSSCLIYVSQTSA